MVAPLTDRQVSQINKMNPPGFNTKLGDYLRDASGGFSQVGKVFYADPTSGNDANPGTSSGKAKKTLQAAIDLCEASRGDLIIRMKGGEAVTTPVLFNKAGITIVPENYGLSPQATGEFFATYSTTLTADPVGIVSAAGVTIVGMGFAGADAGATFFSGAALLIGGVGAATPFGARLIQCRFPKWGLDNRIGLAIEGSSDCLIDECYFEGVGGDFDSGIYLQGAMQNIEISNCRFRDCTYGILCGTFTGSPDGPHAIIKSNIFEDSKVFSAGSGLGTLVDNYSEGATDTGSYNDTVDNLNTAGWTFSGQHYFE